MYKKIMLGALLSAVFAAPIFAETPVASPEVAALGDKLKPIFGEKPDSIKQSPVPGIYEVNFGAETLYVSSDGRYFFSGDLIDGKTRTNLTESARTEGRKAEMAKVRASDTVEFKAKGTEKHVLSVFTDVDCPFCVKLHKEVPKLNEAGITVRYFGYPRSGIGTASYKKLVNIWCADNRQEAMTKAKKGEEVAAKECDNPVAKDFELGQKIGVNGTPALVTDAGVMIPGYRTADELVKILDDIKSGGKEAATAVN